MLTPLNAYERETVITFSDGEPTARVCTHQRRIITKLERNPAATKVENLPHGSQPGGIWELPATLISLRSRSRAGRTTSPKAVEALRKHKQEAMARSANG